MCAQRGPCAVFRSGWTLQLGLMELASEDRRGFLARTRKRRRGDHPRDVIFGPSAGASLAAGGPRGDHPRGVIPGSSAGDALGAGDIDLPEEVVSDELDDLFVDVTTGSPKKEDRDFAKNASGKKNRARVFPGPTPADVQATVVQDRPPDVETYLGHSLGGALQDDVMEVFSPPGF